MVYLDARMGGLASVKGGGTPEILRTGDWTKAERQGRWAISGVQQRSRPAAADHGETGGDDGGGMFVEPPLPLGGEW